MRSSLLSPPGCSTVRIITMTVDTRNLPCREPPLAPNLAPPTSRPGCAFIQTPSYPPETLRVWPTQDRSLGMRQFCAVHRNLVSESPPHIDKMQLVLNQCALTLSDAGWKAFSFSILVLDQEKIVKLRHQRYQKCTIQQCIGTEESCGGNEAAGSFHARRSNKTSR